LDLISSPYLIMATSETLPADCPHPDSAPPRGEPTPATTCPEGDASAETSAPVKEAGLSKCTTCGVEKPTDAPTEEKKDEGKAEEKKDEGKVVVAPNFVTQWQLW
jgi:hypothetical protein